MRNMVLLGDEALAMGASARRPLGGLRLPGHAFHRDHRVPAAPAGGRAGRANGRGRGGVLRRLLVRQREDGLRGGGGRLPGRPAGPGDHEARGRERGRRPLHQLGAAGHPRGAGPGRGRRPGHALLAERAGQPLLRGLRPRPVLRAPQPGRGVRHDTGGLRGVGALPRARDGAPDHAPGALPRRGAGGGGAAPEAAGQVRQPDRLDPAAQPGPREMGPAAQDPGNLEGVQRGLAVQHHDTCPRAAGSWA